MHVACITNIPWNFFTHYNSVVTLKYCDLSRILTEKATFVKENLTEVYFLDGEKFHCGEQKRLNYLSKSLTIYL